MHIKETTILIFIIILQDFEYEPLPVHRMTSISSILLSSFKNVGKLVALKTDSGPKPGRVEKGVLDIWQNEKTGNIQVRPKVVRDGRLRML